MELLEAINYFGNISSNYGSLAATLLSAIIIFAFKEYIRRPKELSGEFFLKTTTQKTAYNPYNNLMVFHTIHIVSDGVAITGHSEKTGEISQQGDIEYIGENRAHGTVTGRIERNYLRYSILHVIIKEKGEKREYSISIKIPIKKRMHGTFYSTAADSSGTAEWRQKKFLEHPSKSSPRQFTLWEKQ